ncbi:hypothetical protein L226DRAFT_612740 [Lentinus tigrinus ALCF2SS1-7]|uniref:Uncharacterized protein n=1 Tax=Lentinus tigrinus ALCF2SS1-6 TaxID=1328759 RepID=A0A5C2SHZ2_9APHY|nr:hypothetical protein L227DRAFT_652792 [Lentinus tigrinus ALCF2SS1-6]RPD75079.1 hypothetical protein L226DRAFT_612740 [Lentinus tigrinus ALCF2SS1-7]
MATASSRFHPYATPEECVKGKPFPATLPYETTPPVYHRKWSSISSAFRKSNLLTEWMKECGEEWPTARPEFFIWGRDDVLVYITDNYRQRDIDRSTDEDMMKKVKDVVGETDDPVWYMVPDN